MRTTIFCLATCVFLGVSLAQSWLPVGAGFLGGGIMLGTASWLHAKWQREPAAPELAERGALLSSGATLVCLGFFLAKLYLIGPDFDTDTRIARSMANQLWLLIAASVLAQWIARSPETARDERDSMIASNALRLTVWVVLAMQLALVMWFSFMKDGSMSAMSAGMLVHLLIGTWMLAHVFYDLTCLRAYMHARKLWRELS